MINVENFLYSFPINEPNQNNPSNFDKTLNHVYYLKQTLTEINTETYLYPQLYSWITTAQNEWIEQSLF